MSYFLKLPKLPVHLYEVITWKLYGHSSTVQRMRFVYHAFTRWKDFDPDRPGGADLVEDWMVYEDDNPYPSGRICDWKALPASVASHFATRAQAIERSIWDLQKELTATEHKVEEVRAKLLARRGQLTEELAKS